MKNVLGIDIGTISISLVIIDKNKKITYSDYLFHNGEVEKNLMQMIKKIDLSKIGYVSRTSSSPNIINNAPYFDSRICYIEAVKELNPKYGSLLIVGGEKFGLIQFDESGNYLNYKSNTSCAAGTGSFLDQQARRLNIDSIEEFSQMAFNNKGNIPKIASRCAVFAKTDLIHAQQEGYSTEEICDGLCYGLAKNITDTLFTSKKTLEPLIFTGGVSKNPAVLKYIKNLTKMEVLVDENCHLYGAYGACLNLLKTQPEENTYTIDNIIKVQQKEKEYHYEKLELKLSDYPDFSSLKKYDYTSKYKPKATPVETDIYQELKKNSSVDSYLGIDIGSTSTKAAIVDESNNVVAGFYTRTSGRPLEACQAIFEAIADIEEKNNLKFNIKQAATTGSGRKFIGNIIGADIALDEITAHARAAAELNTDVDTIIEIGGQDAKFTTLKNGMVTFSIMNNVCAAGTGSFIEEQAKKLGVPLLEYSSRAEKVESPLSSDRCTVFMERDINHYLNDGFSVDEVLASVLHSVRENYLSKVAIPQNIGEKIYFQGATAKNKALVAAFEQKLKKPIMVSKYCHLTGAIGCAIHIKESKPSKTLFKGLEIYKEEIPIHTEICNLCNNHCKIRIAQINDQKCAYGFLCGRDYETKKFINQNKSEFDLLKVRAKTFAFKPQSEFKESATIGLPFALYMVEDMPLWKKFFDNLSIRTISSETYKEGVKEGKLLSGAEFCAPMSAVQGHVKHLYNKCDFVFFPVYLENKSEQKGTRRHYCYYSQFATSVTKSIDEFKEKDRIISPTIKSLQNTIFMKNELLKALKPMLKNNISFLQISSAYDDALEFYQNNMKVLKKTYSEEVSKNDDIKVMLLGRPYTVLNSQMNNKIPDIFGKHSIKAFFQDMLSYSKKDIERIHPMLEMFHWHFATKVIESAEYIAQQKGIYPVFITSFKCSPDSFVTEYFKAIMDAYNKPYLILQLDEHDSSVGYETRIEAAIRAFRNHHLTGENIFKTNVEIKTNVINKKVSDIKNKTILYPNWDYDTVPLICSLLEARGYKVRPIKETPKSIFESLQYNTGQCIPLTAIFYNAVNQIREENLDPKNTVIWMFDSAISCNVRLYPYYIEKLINDYAPDMKGLQVYLGDILFKDFGINTSLDLYFAYLFGGFLKKIGCRIRPYEVNPGETDKTIDEAIKLFQVMFKKDLSKNKIAEEVVSMLEKIETDKSKTKIKAAIFGDLYARDNKIFNQDLIKVIEQNGGEVITTPYTEYSKIIAESYIKRWFKEGMVLNSAAVKMLKETAKFLEGKYLKIFKNIANDIEHNPEIDPETVLPLLDVKQNNTGESMDNILKIFSLINHYPDIGLFVQTNPAYCCPSLVTQAMSDRIEKITGIPVLTLEYDGTNTNVNENVIPYLKYPRKNS